jgi:hypothetical protein
MVLAIAILSAATATVIRWTTTTPPPASSSSAGGASRSSIHSFLLLRIPNCDERLAFSSALCRCAGHVLRSRFSMRAMPEATEKS